MHRLYCEIELAVVLSLHNLRNSSFREADRRPVLRVLMRLLEGICESPSDAVRVEDGLDEWLPLHWEHSIPLWSQVGEWAVHDAAVLVNLHQALLCIKVWPCQVAIASKANFGVKKVGLDWIF